MIRLISICMLAALLLASCQSNESKPVPRRDAYPRVAMYPAEYVPVEGLPVAFEANENADVATEKADGGNYWANISYPAYSAKIYMTFSPTNGATLEAAAANRMERIRLNLNGAPFEVEEFDAGDGRYAMLVCAPSAAATPVQFITTDESGDSEANWLISGAVAFDALPANASTDSLAPMVETMKRDLLHALATLTYNAGK